MTCPEGREGSEGACSRGAAGIGAGIGMRLAAQWLVAGGLVGIPEGACRYAAEGHMAAEAVGAEALVGVLKIIKNASYNKTRESPWWAMEKRPPPWWLRHHLSPCSGGTMGAVHLCYLTLRENIEGLYSPPE